MLQTNTNKLFNKIPDPLANIFERSLRRTWHFFVYATNTTPPVSSKPSRIFRSLSVFTKNSWSWYVNFKYWFPMSSFIELSREAASCLQTHCLQPQINLFEREKARWQTSADDQMVNSLNFGTDTFSLKWPWFCLLAYLVKSIVNYLICWYNTGREAIKKRASIKKLS